ncbi:unnamed protein product [Mesocestoides corti]|uniref:Uncharacterized protein n=1 Tax=Mesocestoides corti TaxID=53468 RepID=A0A0R3ULC3_MESCO|nr:unnamed protein product [Mesocestoides corti]
MVKPFEVAEAMKSVRPELEKIITSSPTCFFRLEESPQENEEGRRGSSRILSETDSLVCDLDETSATREEQALAWARCPNGQAKNYLNATINWMFQGEETQKATTNALPTIPMELLERRLRGANIKPSN